MLIFVICSIFTRRNSEESSIIKPGNMIERLVNGGSRQSILCRAVFRDCC